jgi:mono/diheme cytochrome c family protein
MSKAFALMICALGVATAHADEPNGRALFAAHCASCHGIDGEGGGPVAAAMVIAPPNLRALAARAGGTFPAESIAAYIDGRTAPAAHGSRSMPVWGSFLRADEAEGSKTIGRARMTALVEFIRELQYR